MTNFEPEDMFVSNEDGWIDLPGDGGRISPDGIVYDRNGEPMYSLYEDSEQPINIYLEENEELEEWVRN